MAASRSEASTSAMFMCMAGVAAGGARVASVMRTSTSTSTVAGTSIDAPGIPEIRVDRAMNGFTSKTPEAHAILVGRETRAA